MTQPHVGRPLTMHLGHTWARRALAASLFALAAAGLSGCSPVAQPAQGADAWQPVGGALAVATAAPAAQPEPEGSSVEAVAPPVAVVPRVAAPSAVVANLDTGEVLFAKRADDPRPIASLTKIMTAMI